MDYDEAIRLYGIDKPDLRLPAFTDVRDCFTPENLQELAINANLPVIAIRTPKVGELSRKERDDIKPMFHAKGGAQSLRRLQAHRQQVSRGGGCDREKDWRWRTAI